MKIKNALKKLASLTLAAGIFVSAAGSAMAQNDPGNFLPAEGEKIFEVKKDMGGTGAGFNGEFKFDIKPVGVDDPAWTDETLPEGFTKKDPLATPLISFDGDQSTGTITIANGQASSNLKVKFHSSVDSNERSEGVIFLDYDPVDKTGVYRYEISEQIPDPKADGVKYSDKKYYVDVYVAYISGGFVNPKNPSLANVITGVRVFGTDTEAKVGDVGFTNIATGSLTITKTVEGNQSDPSKTFTFKVKLPEGTYNVEDIDAYINERSTQKEADGDYLTFKDMYHTNTYTIKGIPIGSQVTVSEDTASAQGYNVKNRIDDGGAQDGNTATLITSKAEHNVEIINEKSIIIPTGLVDNILPFIIVIGLAGGFGFFYFKKRNRSSDLA